MNADDAESVDFDAYSLERLPGALRSALGPPKEAVKLGEMMSAQG